MSGYLQSVKNALWAELLKIRRSKMLPGTVIGLSLGPLMGAVFVIVMSSPELLEGNELLQGKAAMTGFAPNWPSFIQLCSQVIGVGGVIVYGFLTSWIFGREYADGTIKDLLVLPVPRSAIVTAKFLAAGLWSLVLSLWVVVLAFILGAALALPGWDSREIVSRLTVTLITAALVIQLCPPAAYAAAVGRGYLAALGFVILSVVLSQIIGALGAGSWFPWAVPAIYSQIIPGGSGLSTVQFFLPTVAGAAGWALTIFAWKNTDQGG